MNKTILFPVLIIFALVTTVVIVKLSNSSPVVPSSPAPTGTITQVKIYLIAVDDHGKTGTKIGCGDSVVGVDKQISATNAPLRSALTELLAVKTKDYGQSGLYNALYQSNLSIDSLTINPDGEAVVNLSGTYQLGGVCDNPRFQSQLTSTVKQFPSVKSVKIFINKIPLETIVSGK
jgi:hypothetical protein